MAADDDVGTGCAPGRRAPAAPGPVGTGGPGHGCAIGACGGPWRAPWQGRDEIVQGWLGQRDEPNQTSFRWSVLHETADMAFVQGATDYHDEPTRTYSNLWMIRLDAGGRCSDFTEWWMRHD